MSKVLKKRATAAKAEVETPATEKKRDEKADAKITGSGSIDVMLAQTYKPERDDPSGWLMSEKMDGVRCYWNGSTMYTRNGKILYAPESWKSQLPKIALDGELWSGRDDFQNIVSIVRKQKPEEDSWSSIKFMIFDAPLLK